MVWQPTTDASIEFNRAWRFRVNLVRIDMFEMIALLAAWYYLPFGVETIAKAFTEDGSNPLADFPLWFESIWVLGTIGLLFYVRLFRRHQLSYLGFERPHWRSDATFALILACLAGGVYVLVLGGLAGAIAWHPEWFKARSVDPIPDVMYQLFAVHDIQWHTILSYVILAPIMEEIWFRGWMYPVVRKHFSPAFAIVAVAVIFAFAHGWPPVSQLIGGLVFTYAYEKRPTLAVPIALHMAGNGSLLLLSWLFAPAS